MPSCAFRKCSNNSRNTNKDNGVTFHSFPQDPDIKEKWIKVIQEDQRDEEWLPTQFSRVCSEHFNESDFYLTPQGRRKLKTNTVLSLCPTSQISLDFTTAIKIEIDPDSPLDDGKVSDTDSIFDTPKIIHIKKQLSIEKSKREKCRKEIVKLKRQNKYLKAKNTSLRELVKSLKEECAIIKKISNNEHTRMRKQIKISHLESSKKEN